MRRLTRPRESFWNKTYTDCTLSALFIHQREHLKRFKQSHKARS